MHRTLVALVLLAALGCASEKHEKPHDYLEDIAQKLDNHWAQHESEVAQQHRMTALTSRLPVNPFATAKKGDWWVYSAHRLTRKKPSVGVLVWRVTNADETGIVIKETVLSGEEDWLEDRALCVSRRQAPLASLMLPGEPLAAELFSYEVVGRTARFTCAPGTRLMDASGAFNGATSFFFNESKDVLETVVIEGDGTRLLTFQLEGSCVNSVVTGKRPEDFPMGSPPPKHKKKADDADDEER